MTSRRGKKQCYVYITLPGETKAVTAAKFELSKNRQGENIGRLVYGRSYLARNNAVEIDPVELKLSTQVYETALMDGVFGALRDASPDYWGRLIIDRANKVQKLDEMDYLLQSADDRAGALGFGHNKTPPAPLRQFNKTIDLKKLQATALEVLNDDKIKGQEAEQVQRLLLLGTSMGGARPKAVVEDRYGLWVAKFNKPDDRWNYARVEHAMLALARTCGINTAQTKITKVARKDVLLVKRFDREKKGKGYLRARMVSGLTLLRADERSRDLWSYPALAETIRRVSGSPRDDAKELFLRMCFNALTSNLDDHPRNHAIIAKDREWNLSPAYDLTPSPVISEEHRDLAMSIGDFGRFANKENLLSQCGRFLLSREEAEAIIADMENRIRNTWYEVARKAKVTISDCNAIRRSFVYPGFSSMKQAA